MRIELQQYIARVRAGAEANNSGAGLGVAGADWEVACRWEAHLAHSRCNQNAEKSYSLLDSQPTLAQPWSRHLEPPRAAS
jgi:hypothetical protein